MKAKFSSRKGTPWIASVLVLIPALWISTAACALDWNLGVWQSVTGSGTIKSEHRAVSGYTGIALDLNGLVEVQQGSVEGLTIETDDNLLPLIETEVDHGTLKIRPVKRNTSFTTRKMKFTVYVKTLDSLAIAGSGDIRANALKTATLKASIAGSGDIEIKSLEADALSIAIAGSGDFTASGRSESLTVRIAGSGDVQTGKLESKTVEVRIAGSGDATVWARETLHVKVAGSGDVNYFGDAQVKKSISGSGSVKRLGAAPEGL